MKVCQRCGARLMDYTGLTTLIGKAHARLCIGCSNAWHTYFLTLPEYVAWQDILAQKAWLDGCAIAGQAPTEVQWRLHVEAQQGLRARLFALGLAWLAVPLERKPTP